MKMELGNAPPPVQAPDQSAPLPTPPINRFISVGKSEQVDADSNMLEKTKT
jgi:hypothetical protein